MELGDGRIFQVKWIVATVVRAIDRKHDLLRGKGKVDQITALANHRNSGEIYRQRAMGCVGLGFTLAPTWAWAKLRHRNSSKDGRLVYGGGQTLNLVKAELLHRVLKLQLKRYSPVTTSMKLHVTNQSPEGFSAFSSSTAASHFDSEN
ncbi:hypothetical protein OIU79_020086 [Salix purpurea]|uniref:Uncharacterized protein n=1 Tax=Salix purpurea TaxID=77065 RepID=A0A9Q0SJX2_SALPP|nr:hypothetical protein OIU79_020086 [Salix purpurea]